MNRRMRRIIHHVLLLLLFGSLLLCSRSASAAERWTPEKAKAWHEQTGWLVGSNFAPSSAINQLEMWQAETFDLAAIDRELGWAEKLGFNCMRVFLHHLLWDQDPDGFKKRIDQFLETADRHGIGVMFVLLDGVWDPHPKLGPQRAPKPRVHNSGWVQSPGAEILKDPARHAELEGYIKGIIAHYRHDKRVHAWDLFNEPDNENRSSYFEDELPNKAELALMLLKKAFAWAREVNPSQPLTAGVWRDDWSDPAKLSAINKLMLGESDVLSFHSYSNIEEVKKRVEILKGHGRPIICTEYMSRPSGSTFDPVLGYLKDQNIGAYNWGLVSGKTQTIYPWDSWGKTYTAEPAVWFHDIFRKDGTPFNEREVSYIQKVTGAK